MPAQGLLSLTYHLAHDESYRTDWLNGSYDAIFEEFGITDPEAQELVMRINDDLGTMDDAQVREYVDRWMALMGDDILARHTEPKILW